MDTLQHKICHALFAATHQQGLLRRNLDWQVFADSIDRPVPFASEDCLLSWLVRLKNPLTTAAQDRLLSAIDAGHTLRVGAGNADHWLGIRLYFAHARFLDRRTHFTVVVSSRVGKHASNIPDWTHRLDCVIRECISRNSILLFVNDTAADSIIGNALKTNQALYCTASVDSGPTKLADWLARQLAVLASSQPTNHIAVSPPLASDAPGARLTETPARDRLGLALADRVYVLHVRPNGHLHKLLLHRLSDDRFETGSVMVALGGGQRNKAQQVSRELLEARAVGWYLPERPARWNAALHRHCDLRLQRSQRDSPTHVITRPPRWWTDCNEQDWPYLAHCTRGLPVGRPEHSLASQQSLRWVEGVEIVHPLVTLIRILSSGRLLGQTALTRTDARCVSLSAVPLLELLSRRCFQSHLGRWDWEPYGILFRKSAVVACGGHSVIYGDEQHFNQLRDDQRPFFQPAKRRKPSSSTSLADNTSDWSNEREWRHLGDLKFSKLAANDMIVFVSTEREAAALARQFARPVIWTGKTTR